MSQIDGVTQDEQTLQGLHRDASQDSAADHTISTNGLTNALPLVYPISDASTLDPNGQSLSHRNQQDEILELFEDIEQLVTSTPSPRGVPQQSSKSQSALPIHAMYMYNPSIVNPAAPSLPSARHRMAERPYHLSTDHHSAILSLSKRPRSPDALLDSIHLEDIVPRKRPHSLDDHKEAQHKRSRRPSHYTHVLIYDNDHTTSGSAIPQLHAVKHARAPELASLANSGPSAVVHPLTTQAYNQKVEDAAQVKEEAEKVYGTITVDRNLEENPTYPPPPHIMSCGMPGMETPGITLAVATPGMTPGMAAPGMNPGSVYNPMHSSASDDHQYKYIMGGAVAVLHSFASALYYLMDRVRVERH